MAKEIIAVAQLEKDARNFFFIKMLYGYSKNELHTVYEIEDEKLLEDLIEFSSNALKYENCIYCGDKIILFDTKKKYFKYSIKLYYDSIIVGTLPDARWDEMNYLVRLISLAMKKGDRGKFFIQYKDKIMNEEEFYEAQDELK